MTEPHIQWAYMRKGTYRDGTPRHGDITHAFPFVDPATGSQGFHESVCGAAPKLGWVAEWREARRCFHCLRAIGLACAHCDGRGRTGRWGPRFTQHCRWCRGYGERVRPKPGYYVGTVQGEAFRHLPDRETAKVAAYALTAGWGAPIGEPVFVGWGADLNPEFDPDQRETSENSLLRFAATACFTVVDDEGCVEWAHGDTDTPGESP